MSAPILNSNANSALISTLANSSALVNPFIYNLEKLLPFGANYWTKIDPVQGNQNTTGMALNSTIDFDLPKWGFLRTCILKFGVITSNTPGTTDANVSVSGVINLIDSVEILSASRRIQYLSWADILACYSDLPPEYRQNLKKHLTQNLAVENTDAKNTLDTNGLRQGHQYGISLPFALFGSHKLNPNLLFQEPLRIRVNLSNGVIGMDIGTPATTTLTTPPGNYVANMWKPQLHCEYFNPPKEMDEEVLDRNYGDGELTLLTYDFHDENEAISTNILATTVGQVLTIDVKDVGVISDMYVMCYIDSNNNTQGTVNQNVIHSGTDANKLLQSRQTRLKPALGKFFKTGLKVENITITANGQELFNMDGELMECWSRKTDAKDGYAYGDNGATSNQMIGEYIYKIPFSLSDDKRIMTGGMSLRELHNVQVKVRLPNYTYSANTIASLGTPTANAVQNQIGTTAMPDDFANHSGTTAASPSFKITARVMLKKYQVLTVESANGRVNTSVAN